jgi:hypothetical protein
MAHGGDGGRPPCSCWNACGRRIDGSHAYRSAALTAGHAGAGCSTAHYRRDDRAPAACEPQLIREARRRAASVDGVPGRARAATPIQRGGRSVWPSRLERSAAVFAGLS